MVNRGWLYGLIVLLAQTCNPYYSANDTQNQYEENIVFEESEVDEIPEQVFEEEEEEIMLYAPADLNEPPLASPEAERIFKVVEEMPRFPGCESKGLTKRELKECSDEKLMKFIYENIKYPKVAKSRREEGRAITKWVVNKDGSISDIKILRNPCTECGEEAVRVIKMMPKWIPGKQRGKAVTVEFTCPIVFKLDEEK